MNVETLAGMLADPQSAWRIIGHHIQRDITAEMFGESVRPVMADIERGTSDWDLWLFEDEFDDCEDDE